MRLFATAAILAAMVGPVLSDDLTPATLRAMLERQDATAVVQSLGEAGWDEVLAHVEAGDGDWIALVSLLGPGTDAGTSEALIITLSRALKSNPEAVLNLLTADFYSAADICVDNDIEVSAAEVVAFIDAAMAKVEAVREPSLMEMRKACLSALADSRVAALG